MRPWEAPARLLPVPFPPVHGEVLGWYLHRLATANSTTPGRIAQSLGPSGHMIVRTRTDALPNWTPAALPRLAIMTGTSVQTLQRSLPALAYMAARDRGETARAPRRLHVACPHCMRRRNITKLILAHLPIGQRLCPKHGIWLEGDTHYRLEHLPEVIDAQHRHQRLTSRFPDTIEKATIQTRKLLHSWLTVKTQPTLLKRWEARFASLPHQDSPYFNLVRRTGGARGEIVAYPEFVSLLGMIADPRWRRCRIPDSRLVTAEQHQHAMNIVFTEAERRLAVSTLRDMPKKKAIQNDPLSRWVDPRGRVRFTSTTTGTLTADSPSESASPQVSNTTSEQDRRDTDRPDDAPPLNSSSAGSPTAQAGPAELQTACSERFA
jgi:hypothetical protein